MSDRTSITRRAALAGAAALPLAGFGVDVQSRDIYGAAASDPAVRAFQAWRAACAAHRSWFTGREDWADDDPEERALSDAEWIARKALAETVATSPAGLLGQIVLALDTFGTLGDGGQIGNPDDYSFGAWADDIDGKLLRSLLTGAQRLA